KVATILAEVQRLERVRTEFVANVSHELRTPLTVIKGYLETLLDETPAQPETHRRFLEVAYTHASRLSRLVDDLLELSNLETGKGIPPSDMPRLTERFYRVDKARSRELGGTGLGLAIVKHLVQAHGGELVIESDLGKGTTVSFTLAADL